MKLSVVLFLLLTSSLYSQDIILTISGEELFTKVIEINQNEIKYKLFNNLDGPLYSVDKSTISNIKYSNGNIDFFNKTTQQKEDEYREVEKNNIESLFARNNKAYILKESHVNEDAVTYFKKELKKWNYWNIVENLEDADFVIHYFFDKKAGSKRGAKVILMTKNDIHFLESEVFYARANQYNGFNPSRKVGSKVIEKFLKKYFK